MASCTAGRACRAGCGRSHKYGVLALRLPMTTPIPEVSVKPKPLYRRLGVFLCGAVATAVITFYVNAYLSRPAHEKTDEAALELKTGLGFVSAGDFTRAHAAFDRATALDPMNSAAWANLGAAAAKLGRPTEAIRAYEHSLTLHPDNWLAHYNLACLLTRQGERTEAIEHIARAVGRASSIAFPPATSPRSASSSRSPSPP